MALRDQFEKERVSKYDEYEIPQRLQSPRKGGISYLLNSEAPIAATFGGKGKHGSSITIYVKPQICEAYGEYAKLVAVGFAEGKKLIKLTFEFRKESFTHANTFGTKGVVKGNFKAQYQRKDWPFKWPEEGAIYSFTDWEASSDQEEKNVIHFFGKVV